MVAANLDVGEPTYPFSLLCFCIKIFLKKFKYFLLFLNILTR
jgi:hypothetical protein